MTVLYIKKNIDNTTIGGNDMKKLITIFCLSLLICGCTNNNTNSDNDTNTKLKYNDGEYTEAVTGYAGTFNLTVTIKNDKITSVVIGENNETPSIGGVAAEKMRENILSTQFNTPDMVSGATVTSEGIVDAFDRIKTQAENK